jgi:hypothetical protein
VSKADKKCDAIWGDDHVELLLDTALDRKRYVRFTCNPNGIVAEAKGFNDAVEGPQWLSMGLLGDGRDLDKKWSAPCTARGGREEQAWTVEAAIPWNSLGVPSPRTGTRMGLQLTRLRKQSEEASEWSCTGRDRNTGAMLPPQYTGGCILYHSPLRFGILEFE